MSVKEIIKHIRHIEVYAEKTVEGQLLGRYKSSFQGQGMEFSDVREYVWGDDVRRIDWNVTSRTGKTYLKTYVEDRHMSIVLAVDQSSSMFFSSQFTTKTDLALQTTAMLALSASKDQNHVGLALHNHFELSQFIPPHMGQEHAISLLHKLVLPQQNSSEVFSKKSLSRSLMALLRKRTTIFLISDFWLTKQDYEAIKKLSRAHYIIPILIEDPLERELITKREMTVQNMQTGQIYELSSADIQILGNFYKKERERFRVFCLKNNIKQLVLSTERECSKDLYLFFSSLKKETS